MFVDTNVLLRTLQPQHPQHETANTAIRTLKAAGQDLHLAPQNLVEVWAVATRPATENGLGMTIENASVALTRLKNLFNVLIETKDIYPVWESLVIEHRVSGKTAHDARLVAAMRVHGLTSILTFNTSDFTRYPGIEVVHPEEVAPATH